VTNTVASSRGGLIGMPTRMAWDQSAPTLSFSRERADTATRADPRHVAAEGSPERRFMRDSALSLVMFELFALFLGAQSVGELAVYKV
jgi:hypothetical protein